MIKLYYNIKYLLFEYPNMLVQIFEYSINILLSKLDII